MSTPVTTYDKRPVIVSPTAPTSLEQLRYLWLDISETTPVLRYYNSTGIWEAINGIDTSSFLTTNGVQTITGAKTFNTGTITVADITVNDVTIEGIDTIKLTDDDTHVPTSKLVEDTLVSAISGLETSIDGKLATKANTADVVLKTDISTSIPSAGAVDTKVASEKAVADSLTAKQNTLKYYSEGTNTVTIETPIYPNTNVSIKAGATGLEMGHGSSGTSTTVKLGVFSADTVSQGLTVAGGDVDIVGDFHINGSSPDVTTIVDSINMEGGGENALPTANAVRVAVNQIKTDLGSALTYKGSVDTYDQLPEEAAVGDTWNVAQAYQTYPAGTNYAWTGTAWDALGGSVDLSGYQTKSDDTLATSAKTVVGAINEVNTTLSNKQNKLLYYSETPGDAPSATISVTNINLRGSVAEGYSTTASGLYSHAEGSGTEASGNYSHSEGYNTKASANFQHVLGFYNIEDTNITPYIPETANPVDTKGIYATIIGNGHSIDERSNAQTVSWTGITWSQTDVRAGGTDQDSATHSLAAKQNATDNSLETTDKTIVGAINELKTDKQNTLKYYSESDSSTDPSSNNAQVSISVGSDYEGTLNLGSDSSNGIQTINIGGSANTRNINIGTKVCGENNTVTIGNTSDGVSLTINAQRSLTLNTSENSDLQGTGIAREVAEAPTNRKLTTEKAVAYNTSFKKEINKIYFNSGKINNDVFQLPKFPFTICVTCKVDSWYFDGSENGQTLFQFGNGYRVTTSPWGGLYFRDNTDSPKVALAISGSTTGNETYLSEYFASLGNIDDFLGKKHTIVAIARDPGDNPTRPNWNIYLDGVEVTTIAGASNKFNENATPLNVPTHFVVNTSNLNFWNQPASDNPLEIYDISLFDFDLSEEGSAYSVLDYANGKLIPPELYVEDITSTSNKLWFKVDPQIYEFGGKRILKDLSLHGFDCYVSTADNTVATDADASYDTLMSKVDDHLLPSWIDKKASPQLYLERGVLSVPELANYPFKWPLTLAIEYELESLTVGNATNQNCVFFNYWDIEWSDPVQPKGFRLELIDNGRLYLYLGHPNEIISTEQFVAYTTNGGKGIPTGKHTIVVCIGGEVVNGGPEYLKMYLDGNELDTTVVTKTLSGNNLAGTRPLSICSTWNYSNPSATGGVLVPINIARPYIFNFRIDDNYTPYTLEDYVKGVCLPAEITLGNPNFTFGSIYGNGWSTTDNGTKITVTSANTTWPALFANVIPRGYCWKSILDVNLTFSGNAVFEIYTQCKKTYIEVYNYSTGVTTLFSSTGREGGWGGGNPFGLSSSGHYKITIYGHYSTGKNTANFAIGPLSSGTITRTEVNLQYTILAPESYTITEYDQVDIASPSTYSNMQIRSVASKVSTSISGDEIKITVNEDLSGNALAIYFPGYAEIGTERSLSSVITSLSDSIKSIHIRAAQNQNSDFGSPSMVLTSDVPQRSMTFSEATSISGIGVTILYNGSNISSGTVFTIKGLQVSADTRKIIPDSSGNNYTVLAVESGNISGTNEYWTGIVRGTSDNALSVTETALKKKPLTSLQFNVYGTDKKIIPGKYMRLIFSQDSNGNVTPTYISEEEWNDVYDV